MKRPFIWIVLCLLCLAGAWWAWQRPAKLPAKPSAPARVVETPTSRSVRSLSTAPKLSAAVSTNTANGKAAATNVFAWRLSNTAKSLGQLAGDHHAILLENALIDTGLPLNLSIPKPLQAQGDPGAYIVQARGPINNAFRAMLGAAGAEIISYIPNDAYLVRAEAGVASGLAANSLVQVVIPYEPYYKVQSSLMRWVGQTLPNDAILTLGLYPGQADAGLRQIEKAGGKILSSGGGIVQVLPPADWTALAQLPLVHIVEPSHERIMANDISRVTVGVSTDTITNTDYLNLYGSNVIVEVNDSGIDKNHPDFFTGPSLGAPNRIFGDFPISLVDTNGHGTHVAGIIAGNGFESSTINGSAATLPSGSVTNADFRGKAPLARLFSVVAVNQNNIFGMTDQYLQEAPALTNALISNNSWGYGSDPTYDLAAASYDAAVRDALPERPGSQPVLFVFSAGNDGGGGTDGGGGNPDTISSPGTAKNVITVGALEQLRGITNIVTDRDGNSNAVWQAGTDTGFQLADYSSRGNVGVGTEGSFGRFKPDVVAPGTFVVSTRSEQWDTNAYYNPTNVADDFFTGEVVNSNAPNYYSVSVPANAVRASIRILPNVLSPVPFPTNLTIYVSLSDFPDPTDSTTYDFARTARTVSIPPDSGSLITDITSVQNVGFIFAIVNTNAFPVNFDLITEIATTNDLGNYYQVLQGMNELLSPWYRYESGTSISTPAVSGVLALMQDYFTNTLAYRPSPALLKAMLINGSRAVNNYKFAVTNNINFQGWGAIHLPNSLPPGMVTNVLNPDGESMLVIDQDPAIALATGDSRSYMVAITNADALDQALRFTLAWTDPPGDPAAAIKLVNNLDLIVSNLDTHVFYIGNYFASAGDPPFSLSTTNVAPNFDFINNVENIFVPPGAGSNFMVTVIGRRVNVNAVTAQTNNVVQDFALVISSGDGAVTNAFTVVTNGTPFVSNPTTDQLITVVTTTNAPLLNQIVGASTPLLGTNSLALGTNTVWGPDGQLTLGMTNQWHFYIITNTGSGADFTNAAFITFNAFTLSIPRMGVFAPTTPDSTRPQADIDLYVATEPGLTNLDPAVLSNCLAGAGNDRASVSRGGTEFVFYTNSVSVTANSGNPSVYYVGVYSEDHMAAEFALMPIFTDIPFSQPGPKGSTILNGQLLPVGIPDGNPAHPGFAFVFALGVDPTLMVKRVVAYDTIAHQNIGDLVGVLGHGDQNGGSETVVLNNRDALSHPSGIYSFIYDDSGQGDIAGSQPTDGPGNLNKFVGQSAVGPWILTEVDNAQTQIGSVTAYSLMVEPHQDLGKGVFVTLNPGEWFIDFIPVPVGFSELIVSATNTSVEATPSVPVGDIPIAFYERFGLAPTSADYDQLTDLTNCLSGNFYPTPVTGIDPGNSLSSGPPLPAGVYYIGLFNSNSTPQTVFVIASLIAAPVPNIFTTNGPAMPIQDDAVTSSTIFINNTNQIASVNVGLIVTNARISDLTFTLVSPTGQRILLMENRGGTTATNLGHLVVTTNFFGTTTAGGAAANTNVIEPVSTSGILHIDRDFFTAPDEMQVYYSGILIFDSGLVPGNSPFNIPYGPPNTLGSANSLVIVMNANNNTNNPNTAWEYTPTVIQLDYNYLTFTEDTNLTDMPIKFALPPYDLPDNATNIDVSDFEQATNGDYVAFTNIFDGFGGWTLPTNLVTYTVPATNLSVVLTNVVVLTNNEVSVVTDPGTARGGSNYLALAQGVMTRTIPVTIGRKYSLTYAYRGPGIAGWWRGEGNATDSSDPENYGNNGSLIGQFNFPAGEVGQAFQMEAVGQPYDFAGTNNYVQIRQAPFMTLVNTNSDPEANTNLSPVQTTRLDVGTGSGFTVEGWINPTNALVPQPLVEWLARTPTNGADTNLVIEAGPFLDRDTGHYYYLLAATNWTISERWATQLGGHLVTLDTANEQNWVYDTFSRYGQFNRNLWIGLNDAATPGTFVWSSGLTNVVYTNWVAGQPFNCSGSDFYTAILGPTNKFPGLWVLEKDTGTNNNGVTCGVAATNFTYGVVEVNEIQTNGVRFWISVTNSPGTTNLLVSSNGCLYANLVDTTNGFHEIYSAPGWIQTNVYQHVALTYDTNTGTARLYYNGTNVATTNLGVFVPKTTGDLLLGKDMSRLTNNFFTGRMDEMSVYKRFLSDAEILAIYNISALATNHNTGKFDPSITPAFSLAKAQVTLDTVGTNLVFGDNAIWQMHGFTFTAVTNSLFLQIAGLEPGLLLDSFSLAEAQVGNLYYLPEISLDALNGDSAYGNWTLEIWDNRRGGVLNSASLVSWQLQFTMQTNVPVLLNADNAATNTVPPGAITYYAIPVPIWATSANNLLVSASRPVDLLFNQTTVPTGSGAGDITFLTASTSGSFQMTSVPPLSTPPLLPGQTYYLGVRNPNTHSATVVVEVDFDMIVLTNGIPFSDTLSTNFTDVERYYAFDVTSNAYAATFQLLQLSGNADLVVRKGAPLPTLTSSDYGSFSTTNADENIYVLTNSSPVPLSAGRWYLGVFRRDPGPVRFTVLAKELDLQVGPAVPAIIDLTNNVPFTFTAGAGAALTNFFRFTVTNTITSTFTNLVGSIHFELYDQDGNGDLTVQTNAPPLAPPFFQSSQQPGRTPELIYIRTNSALTNLAADWYLGVPNHEITNLNYTILAVIDTNLSFPAFPGAQGAGGGTLGGRGGDVYHVLNLNDDGPGSLRYGITSFIGTGATNDPGTGTTNISGSTTNLSGGRTIVFDVPGTINLLTPLVITNSYLTIAGQTAPGGGITVAGQMTTLASAHDVIIRYLRFRPVTTVPVTTNATVSWHSSFEEIPRGGSLTGIQGGWTISSGNIDVNNNGTFGETSDEGTNYIDLDGDSPGTISTNIPTVPGKSYTLNFAWSRNADTVGITIPSANVLINGSVVGTLIANFNNTWAQLNWHSTSYVFTATSPSTLLTFQSLDTGPFPDSARGVLLDCIDLSSADLTDSLENTYAGDYVQTNNPAFDGWTVLTNQVTVISNASLAYTGTNLLALADGVISRSLPTVPGTNYLLTFAYRGPGMLSLWRGESDANDSINGNNPGTANNITFTNGLVGRAFLLDGSTSYVNVPDSASLDALTDHLTVDIWMQAGQLTPNADWKGLITKGNDSWRLQATRLDRTTYIAFSGAIPSDMGGTRIVNDGQWHHVAATYDGTQMSLYVDGTLDQSQPATGPVTLNPYDLCIGANSQAFVPSCSCSELGYFFNGLLDEPGVYRRALSASEIKAIYNRGARGKYNTNAPSIAQGLAEAQVTVNGIAQPAFYGDNTNWQTAVFQFTATGTNTPLVIAGLEPGMLLDAFTLGPGISVATDQALQLTNVANVIADHVSTSWATNALVSVLDSTGVTVQWSMLADSIHAPAGKLGFSLGAGSVLRYGTGQLSFHHNLYADNYTASPFLDEDLSLDFVNNVIYNWGLFSGYSGTNDPNIIFSGYTNYLNYVCNYLIAGPDTAFYSTNAAQTNFAFWGGITNTWIFQTNNFIDSDTNGILNGANTDWGMFTNHFTPVSRRFGLPPVTVDEAFLAYEKVLDFAGAALSQRDSADIGIVGNVRAQTGVILSAPPSLPTLSSNLLWLDSDQDGLPDFWEITFGLNPTNASQNQLSLNASYVGYTDLEEYLNWLANPHALTVTNTPVGVDLYVMSGNSGRLSFSVTNAVNGTVYLTNVLGSVTNTDTFSNRYAIFTPTPGFSGYAAFDYYVTNNDTFAYFGPVTVSVVVSAVPPTYAIPVTALTGGVPVTNTVPPGNIAVFLVTVPANANMATNILIFASSPMLMWFDTNYPPTTNVLFLPNVTYPTGTNGSVILDTVTTTPRLVPGSTYYLLLQNTNTITVTNAIEVDFHLIFPPVLPAIPDQVVLAGSTLVVSNAATGEPPLTYTLTSTVSNAPLPVIDANGTITWTPTISQGPAVYAFTTVVTDGNVPQLSATNSFLVVVVLTNGLPAFPGAEGAGAFAIGGRGGDVYHVTNLRDDGPGSLRFGLRNSAARTIVFDVSGTITNRSDLIIRRPYVTIAGQTAPGGGITLAGRLTGVKNTHDMVIRYLRCRPGDINCPAFQDDSFHFDVATNSIADHLSASWSIDEALSTTDSTNITVQWSMIAEPLNNSCHVKGTHGYGSLIRYGYGAISYHHNLYADCYSRNPRLGDNIRLDFINNVVFNWGILAGYNEDDAADNPQGYTNSLNYIGNYLIAGTNTSADPNIAFRSGVPSPDFTRVYQSGNFIDNNPYSVSLNGADTGWSMFSGNLTQLAAPISFYLGFPGVLITTNDAPQTYEQVLAFAGTSLLARDRVDTNIVAGVRYKNGIIIDTENQVGGWPVLNSAPLPVDTDQDGMPDYWEITLALTGEASMNPSVPNNNHSNPDGYTDLEHYIDWLAAPHALTVTNTPVAVDLYAIVGRTGNLGFSVANGTNGAVTLSNSIATFTPANNYFGFASFTFNVTNLDTTVGFGPVTVSVMVSATNIFTTGSPIVLTNGVPQTNSVLSGGIVYYAVTVPTNADLATNLLRFATAPVRMWFDTNFPPAPSQLLLPNVAFPTGTNGLAVLSTNTTPPLVPGSTYYLGVENTNTFTVTFALEVDFHLASGTNTVVGPIVINSITHTNIGGTNGFLLAWYAPTNDAFMVQWSGGLAPMVWSSFTNVITYAGPLTPTNGLFTFFDDGSQTGGFGPERYYRLLLVGSGAVLTNGVPQTNSVSAGNTTFLLINVPANAVAASNLLLSATGPVNVFFNQAHPPTDNTNAGDFLELSAASAGSFLLASNSAPPLVPGASYYLGVQNPGAGDVTFVFQVDFSLAPTSAVSGFTLTATNGGVWLKWTGLTNYQYQVQWTTNLAPAAWTTISNIVLTSTTGLFTFYDDGTLTGGFGGKKFYRLIIYPFMTPIPQTLSIASVTVTSVAGTNDLMLRWSAPTNYHYGIQWTTNLALPFSSWSVIASPVFAVTNSVYTFVDNGQTGSPTGAKYFRLLEYP